MGRYKKLRENINVSVRAVYWYLFRKYIDENRLVTIPYGWIYAYSSEPPYSGSWERFHKNCYNLFYNLIYNTPEIPDSVKNEKSEGGDFGMSECVGIDDQIWATGFDCLDADHNTVLDIVKSKKGEWKVGLAELNSDGYLIEKKWEPKYGIKVKKKSSAPPITRRDYNLSGLSKETCNTAAAAAGGKRKNKSKRRTRKGKI